MGRIPMGSQPQFPYPPQPQPQPQPQSQPQHQPQHQPQPQPQPQHQHQPQPHVAYYSYAPSPPPPQQLQVQPQQAAVIYPPPQSNVIAVQGPQYQPSREPIGAPVHYLPMPSPQAKVVHNGSWTTGLFDCMDDPTNALITALFPCVTFGQIADVLDNGHTNCATSGIIYAVAPCFVSAPYRRKLRQRFGLVEAPASDRIVHFMFEPCGLCQEYRELNNRGFNPALGHHGNLINQQTAATMVPPRNQMMN